MNILVVGANGQIGKHLVKLIQENGDQARAFIRKQEQADYFKDLGAEVTVANLEDEVDTIAEAAEGVDAVVFTAGSGGSTGKDKTLMIDLDGAVKTIQAAEKANVKRFVMISSFDTSREAIQSAPESFAPYVVAKHYADEWLIDTDLDYTIIHPGLLTNEPGTNQVNLGADVERGEVPREDIAKVIYTSLKNDTTIGKSFRAVGGETPIEEAVQSVNS
ncbi:SDR family oxidoreductase [Oceanobacillus locisalsi]|uniref:SDR family oxidoreductase n=1 Tax=Oceanobacillus locisalsi TaxID=546107 RepID=A0ABW3NLY1_9BACI